MPIETPKLTQDAERGGSVGTSGGAADLDNTTLPSPKNDLAVVKFTGRVAVDPAAWKVRVSGPTLTEEFERYEAQRNPPTPPASGASGR